MSQANVDLVRRAVKAFNDRDFGVLSAMSNADLIFTSALAAVDGAGGTYTGTGAWESYFADMDEAWESWQVVDLEIFEAPDDRVAAKFRLVGKGRTSGIEVAHETGIAYEVRDGKFSRLTSYLNADDALKAVGLSD